MAKASRQAAALRREQILVAATRKVREHGLGGVSVPELTAEAGMTHGGFYKHFESKAALEAQACARALEEMAERVWALVDADASAARDALFDFYLTPAHRDDPAAGCAIAALANDASRAPHDAASATLSAGIGRQVEVLTALCGSQAEAAAALSTMVGAVILARATPAPLSDLILNSARDALRRGNSDQA